MDGVMVKLPRRLLWRNGWRRPYLSVAMQVMVEVFVMQRRAHPFSVVFGFFFFESTVVVGGQCCRSGIGIAHDGWVDVTGGDSRHARRVQCKMYGGRVAWGGDVKMEGGVAVEGKREAQKLWLHVECAKHKCKQTTHARIEEQQTTAQYSTAQHGTAQHGGNK
eukprot:6491142-Amphidinium_carterae.2